MDAPRMLTVPSLRASFRAFLFAVLLFSMRQETFSSTETGELIQDAADASESLPSESVRYEYPQTWLDALNRVREQTIQDWKNGDVFALMTTCLRFLNGSLLARQLWNNQTFWQWTVASLVLTFAGQVVLLVVMGHPIRVMALTLPLRPWGPALVGFGAFLLGIPLIPALFVSLVGIPVAFGVWGMLVLAAIVGKMSVFLSIGWGLARAFGARGSSVFPLFVVYGIYATVVLVDPFAVGRALSFVADVLGIGLALWTRFGLSVGGEQ